MPPLAGYVRVSRVGDRAERLISPELQAKRIEEYAQVRGFEVEMLPPELDVSGGALKRPVLEEVLTGVESGRFGGVIVAQLDRLSRLSLTDAHKIIERIESAGGQVVAVAESFDPTTPEGEMGRNVMLSVGRMQRARYAAQFAAAKERAVRVGIWPLPVVPIGYLRGEDRRLVPDAELAPAVVRGFEARATGASWSKVGALIDRGASGASKVVANRVYLGEIRYGEFFNPAAHPPIIDRALFEAAQLTFARPARGKNGPALLAGLVRCAGCRGLCSPDGRAYRCHGDVGRAERCRSPALIAKSIIEPYVVRTLLDLTRGVGAAPVDGDDALAAARLVLDDAEAELAAYQQGVSAAGLGVEQFGEGLRLRAEGVEEARRGLAEARLQAVPVASVDLAATWDELGVEERRHVLRGAFGVVWTRKGSGPAGERVKISTVRPVDLPVSGFRRHATVGVEWDRIEGVVVPSAEDLGEGAGGADAD